MKRIEMNHFYGDSSATPKDWIIDNVKYKLDFCSKHPSVSIDAAPISLLCNIGDEASIDLNVGGKIYLTSFATLKKCGDGIINKIKQCRNDGMASSSSLVFAARVEFLIDRDGDNFRYILNFLRTGKLILPEKFTELHLLLAEVKYYDIQPLENEIIAMLQLRNL